MLHENIATFQLELGTPEGQDSKVRYVQVTRETKTTNTALIVYTTNTPSGKGVSQTVKGKRTEHGSTCVLTLVWVRTD